MPKKEDLKRALEYGTTDYYKNIQQQPTYQTQLEKVRQNYNEGKWYDVKGFLPKFTTAQFEARRVAYQARYGREINIPGFTDVIHIGQKATITAEEMAAHKWTQQHGLPSPLTQEQLDTLAYKKARFLRALASPNPEWARTIGAVGTAMDNVEDALVTISVIGRIAAKIAPRLLGRLVPGLGWVLMGSDILNFGNIASWISMTAIQRKRLTESFHHKNPFTTSAKAARTDRLKRVLPTFGEFLEIAQVTDQQFGVGLCLGGLMGMVQDAAATAFNPRYWIGLTKTLMSGNVDEITTWLTGAATHDYEFTKRALQEQVHQLRDANFRLTGKEWEIRDKITSWAKESATNAWKWLKSAPETAGKYYSDGTIGTMILSTGMQTFSKEDHTKALMIIDQALSGLIPWWIENDPIENFPHLREWQFKAPAPTDPATQEILNEAAPGWRNTIQWPHLGKQHATIEEITFTYAPMIKESLQTYSLRYQHDYTAMVAAQQATEFMQDIIRTFSDDHQAMVGTNAYVATIKALARENFIIPPSTDPATIEQLANYIGEHERKYVNPPNIKDVIRKGRDLGIKWTHHVDSNTLDQIENILPGWIHMQDQLKRNYQAG